MQVIKADGSSQPFDESKIQNHTRWACNGLNVSQSELESSLSIQFYDGMTTKEIADALIMTSSTLISRDKPDYDKVTARFVVQKIRKEANNGDISYPSLASYLSQGMLYQQLDERLLDGRFDLAALDKAIDPERDMGFTYLGIRTLQDRYLLRRPVVANSVQPIYEMPQHLFMRVAMGLAVLEDKPTARAIEFYDVLSKLEFMSSTPTLFNAGTRRPQLSSCYLSYVPDDLTQIFDLGFKETGLLSKFAGGIGNSWSAVRAAGSPIKSTNGLSGGVVPFIHILNGVAVAVNQGGKRKGSVAPYLEMWHADIYEFCELRKKTGDDHLRAHDLHPAAWIPDLFMERKDQDGDWSLFCPGDFPELHDLHGKAFEEAYVAAEASGKARKVVKAMHLWRHLLDMLVRTGYPWINFKDECNRRNPQGHVGVIHNSNLCTEITLNNSATETAVCNLGSVNLAVVKRGKQLQRVVKTAIRMLDNVIDINYYPTENARRSNLRHRPIGMGVMGYQEAMVRDDISWESEAHLKWADELFEELSYFAIHASADLAVEKGAYETFEGSTWSRGLLTIDHAKDQTCHVFSKTEWDVLREKVKTTGIRNSNLIAIAPTATIGNICGTTECVQMITEREVIKENLSGNFVQVSPLRKYDKPHLEQTAWEVDQLWTVRAAAKRQKWICQSQSLNLYRKYDMKGRDLDVLYSTARKEGVKTTYYLRNETSQGYTERTGLVAGQGGVTAPPAEASVMTPVAADEGFICEACQ